VSDTKSVEEQKNQADLLLRKNLIEESIIHIQTDFFSSEIVTQGLHEKWKDMFKFNLSTKIFEISTEKEESEFCL